MGASIKQQRLNRDSSFMLRAFAYGTMLFLGTPIVIIAAYYLVDWEVAVMMLPILYFGQLYYQRIQQDRTTNPIEKKQSIRKQVIRIVWYCTLFGLPLYSVATDQVDLMRYLAHAVAFVLLVNLLTKRRSDLAGVVSNLYEIPRKQGTSLVRVLGLLSACIFILFNDVIWLFLGMDIWIWFHAFAMPFGVGIAGLGLWYLPKLMGYQQINFDDEKRIRGKPPKPAFADDKNRYTTWHVRWDGRVREFNELTYDQAAEMFRRVRWHLEVERQPKLIAVTPRSKHLKRPGFYMSFSHNEEMSIFAEFDSTFSISARYSDSGQGIFESPKRIEALGVPPLLVPEIMRLSWLGRWGEVKRRLTPYDIQSLAQT